MSDISWLNILGAILIASILNEDEDIIEKIKKMHIDEAVLYNSLGSPIPQELKILGNEKYKKFRDEIDEYTEDFINKNSCNKYNPHTEYKEYYLGLNEIRKKYDLGKLVQLECPYGVGFMVDENEVEEIKKHWSDSE